MMILKFTGVALSVFLCLCVLPSISGTCGGLSGDLIFLLDASGSVSQSNFQIMLQFVNDLIDDFDIGSDLVRVGVLTFSGTARIDFNLNDDFDKTSIQNRVSAIAYIGGGTSTDVALSEMTNNMFTTTHGDRSTVPDVGVVITDGLSSNPQLTSQNAALAHAAHVTLFAIGIGTGVTELNSIATDPDYYHVFTVTNFNGLSAIKGAFQTNACLSLIDASLPVTGWTAAGIVGVTVCVAAGLGILAASIVIVKKMVAAKTAVSKLQPPQSHNGNKQKSPQGQSQQKQSTEAESDLPIPGMADAAPSAHPMSTKWPSRLPPINRL